jgi:hypothetical protein
LIEKFPVRQHLLWWSVGWEAAECRPGRHSVQAVRRSYPARIFYDYFLTGAKDSDAMVNGNPGRLRKQKLVAALHLFLLLGPLSCAFARRSRRGGEDDEGTREQEQRSGSRRSRRSNRNGAAAPAPATEGDGTRSRGRRHSTRSSHENSTPPSPPPAWMGSFRKRVETYAPKLERLNRTTSTTPRTLAAAPPFSERPPPNQQPG